jgi:hypothetical protein
VQKKHARGHDRVPRKDERSVIGTESHEPGQPTRHFDEGVRPEGASEVAEIARQQGASQRGFAADGTVPSNDANRGSPPGGIEGVHR